MSLWGGGGVLSVSQRRLTFLTPQAWVNGSDLSLYCNCNWLSFCLFFLQMDLCGIKWRRLSAENLFCVDPLDDPVLMAFTKCLAADILCVWRKVPHQRSHPDQNRLLDLNAQHLLFKKELWIFWYGNEPDLNNILCAELSGEVNFSRLDVESQKHRLSWFGREWCSGESLSLSFISSWMSTATCTRSYAQSSLRPFYPSNTLSGVMALPSPVLQSTCST